MNEQNAAYYLPGPNGRAPYQDDLLNGKLLICEVPRKYRAGGYLDAIRRAVNQYSRDQDETEKKLIEHLLLSDIRQAHKDGSKSCAAHLRSLYSTYFCCDWPTMTWPPCYPFSWRRLNLSCEESAPPCGEPLVLHFERLAASPPERGRKKPRGPRRYEAGSYHGDGMFVPGELWSKEPSCVLDLGQLQKHYDICWCLLPPLDAPPPPEPDRRKEPAGQR